MTLGPLEIEHAEHVTATKTAAKQAMYFRPRPAVVLDFQLVITSPPSASQFYHMRAGGLRRGLRTLHQAVTAGYIPPDKRCAAGGITNSILDDSLQRIMETDSKQEIDDLLGLLDSPSFDVHKDVAPILFEKHKRKMASKIIHRTVRKARSEGMLSVEEQETLLSEVRSSMDIDKTIQDLRRAGFSMDIWRRWRIFGRVMVGVLSVVPLLVASLMGAYFNKARLTNLLFFICLAIPWGTSVILLLSGIVTGFKRLAHTITSVMLLLLLMGSLAVFSPLSTPPVAKKINAAQLTNAINHKQVSELYIGWRGPTTITSAPAHVSPTDTITVNAKLRNGQDLGGGVRVPSHPLAHILALVSGQRG